MKKELNEYITVGKPASFLGVSNETLRWWDAAEKLRARRHPVTGFRLYLKGELDVLLGKVSTAAPSAADPRTRRRQHRKKGR